MKKKEVVMMALKIYTKGQGLVEYALLLVLVALTLIVILSVLGQTIGNAYSNIMTII